MGLLQSTVGMFAPVAGLGLAMTGTKFLAEFRDSDPARAGRILGLSLLMAVVAGSALTGALVLLAPWLATRMPGAPGLEVHLVMASGLLLAGVLESVQIGALIGLGAFAGLARAGSWSGAASIPAIVLLSYAYGLAGAIAGLTLSLIISCLCHGILLRAECQRFGFRATLAGAASERNLLLGFSLPSYVSGLLFAPVAWVGNALLVQRPDGLMDIAWFHAADRFRYVLMFVPLAVSRTTVPALSRLRTAGDSAGYAGTLRWNIMATTAVTLVPAVLCAALAIPLMSLFGAAFRPGWPVLLVLAASAVPTVLNTQLGAPLLADGRAWARAGVDALLAGAILVLAWWLVPGLGAVGLAAAFAGGYTLACLALVALIGRNWHASR